MYNSIPIYTIQTMRDVQRLSRGGACLAVAFAIVFIAFVAAIAITI